MQILEMEEKSQQKLFVVGSSKFSQFRRGYLSLKVNVLANTSKNLHITKRDIFKISFPQSDEKI